MEKRAANLAAATAGLHQKEEYAEWKAAAALRSQAQEVERLSAAFIDQQKLEQRCRELKAERDAWQQRANNAAELLELRITAIRNKTIEECVDACYNKLSEIEAMQAEGAIRSTKIGVSNGT